VTARGRVSAGAIAEAVALLLIALPAAPAHAYVDPMAGGLLIQLLLAGAAGAAMVLRLFWRRIKAFFTRSKPESGDD
jgi:hypothetical protein